MPARVEHPKVPRPVGSIPLCIRIPLDVNELIRQAVPSCKHIHSYISRLVYEDHLRRKMVEAVK